MMCGAECVSTVKATLTEGRERGRKGCRQSNVPREVALADAHMLSPGNNRLAGDTHMTTQEQDQSLVE